MWEKGTSSRDKKATAKGTDEVYAQSSGDNVDIVASQSPNEDEVVLEMPEELRRDRNLRQYNIEAMNLVQSATGADQRPTNGILSNLLKLNAVTNKPQKKKKAPENSYHRRHSHDKASYPKGSQYRRSISSMRSLMNLRTPLDSRRSLDVHESDESEDTDMTMEEKLKITANIAEIILKQDYLILLAKSYATFGSPAHRLEYNMEQASAGLQVESSYAFLPGLILISFGDPDLHTSDTHIVRVSNDYYMDKLDRCYNISRKVNAGELTVGEAYIELEDLIHEAPLYPPWAEVINYAMSSFLICPLAFGGGWEDGVVSGGLGFLVGMMSLLARKIYTYNSVFEITAAILTSLIATALHNRICYVPVMLSAVVILIPGFGVASSVVELAARNIVSGTVRLVYSLFLAFLLAFGMSFGALIYRGFGKLPVEAQVCDPINPYWYFLLFPMITISFAMIMQAAPRQWPAMIGISGVGFTTYYFISPAVPATVSGVVSAFMLAFTGNTYSRLTGKLGFPAILNGVLILVPGGLGVRGIFEAISDSAEGLALAFEMVTICLSLAVGLFFGSLIVYPIGKRKTVLMTY